MGRPKKAQTVDEIMDEDEDLDEIIDESNIKSTKTNKSAGINVAQLVADVRGRYGKKGASAALDIVTATDISLPTSDDSYVLSESISEFWKPLTGVKGIPYGRIVQFAGKADSGKSTLSMLFMKAAQESGALVVLWDSEKKFDTNRFSSQMQGDPSQIAVTRNKNIINGAKEVAWIIRAAKEQDPNVKIFCVWDSIGATLNSSQDDDDEDDYSKQPGVDAREVGWAIKKFNKLIERFKDKDGNDTIAVCCVNQVYANIGSVGFKEKGGGQLEYLSSLILQLGRKSDLLKTRAGQKIKYGIVTRAKVKKNHLFGGEDCVAELDLVVSASGMELADKVKTKESGLVGWDDTAE